MLAASMLLISRRVFAIEFWLSRAKRILRSEGNFAETSNLDQKKAV